MYVCQVNKENRILPALFAATFLVAQSGLVATAEAQDLNFGIGWGRLAGVNSFDNPLSIFGDSWSERGARTSSSTGGEVESDERTACTMILAKAQRPEFTKKESKA